MQRDNKLVGLVFPDYDEAKIAGLNDEGIRLVMNENLNELNQQIPAYPKVSAIEIQQNEFEKTPKKSIKRYLYK